MPESANSKKSTGIKKSPPKRIRQELHLSNELQAQQAVTVDIKPTNKDCQVLNFDLFDKDSVFTECQDTHFICNDFEQHSLISSHPLQLPINSKDELRQSHFEIKIHSGGYYD